MHQPLGKRPRDKAGASGSREIYPFCTENLFEKPAGIYLIQRARRLFETRRHQEHEIGDTGGAFLLHGSGLSSIQSTIRHHVT
ncbi:hypothetical protein [Methanoculleus chikugoensis]|uniref:hypothetical protein n=1 Tax=Methanoculleus chikugoensis TaxID=118126 RepID=UPI001FB1D90B|nr:hypothetical protein [Methanoculleus chikugoensis]